MDDNLKKIGRWIFNGNAIIKLLVGKNLIIYSVLYLFYTIGNTAVIPWYVVQTIHECYPEKNGLCAGFQNP